jgi:hypothetical protein
MTDDRQTDLDRLVRDAVSQAHEQVRRLRDEGRIISRHYDYPSLDSFDSGQPRITHGQGPIDYANIFKLATTDQWSVSFDAVPALDELAQLAIQDDDLRGRLLAPGIEEMNEWRERFVTISASRIPLELLDRLLNTVGDSYTDADLWAAWLPLRNGLLQEKLAVELVVPVCLATFSTTDTIPATKWARVELLPEGEQRARMPKTIWNAAALDTVAAAATHAITISGYEIEGSRRMMLDWSRPDFYPLDRIELAFEALRIATSATIGYAQIYIRPVGWAWDYKADLPPVIQGSFARRYPPTFDDYGWLRGPEIVTETEITGMSTTLLELEKAGDALRLASRRFSNAALRADEDDAVLDLCIALEAALGDRQRNEMTYKLSLRSAAVLGLDASEGYDAATILQRVKRLYDWRSAVVHGDDVSRARRKFVGEGDGATGLEVATSLVRAVLRKLVSHPELRSAEGIDTTVLLARPQGKRASDEES